MWDRILVVFGVGTVDCVPADTDYSPLQRVQVRSQRVGATPSVHWRSRWFHSGSFHRAVARSNSFTTCRSYMDWFGDVCSGSNAALMLVRVAAGVTMAWNASLYVCRRYSRLKDSKVAVDGLKWGGKMVGCVASDDGG